MKDNWQKKPLGELVSTQKGKISEQSTFPLEGFAPIINTDVLRGDIKVWGKVLGSVNCIKNDVLILWDGERSGLCATGYEGVVGSTFAKMSVSNELDSNFLYRFVDFNFDWIQGQRTGTGVPHVPKNLNTILTVNYPPLPQQKKIAKILSTCDAVIEKTEAAIAKYQNIKQGMMHDLFTRGIDLATGKLRPTPEQAPDLYKDSELGKIPRDWEVKRLDEIGQVISGGTPSSTVGEFWGGNILWVTPADLSTLKFGEVTNTERKITMQGLNSSSALMISKNSIVLSSRAPIGYCAIVKEDFTTNQGCKSISPNLDNVPEFFYYNIVQHVHRIKLKGEGTTFAEISKKELEKLKFVKPLEQEQLEISKRLKSIDEKLKVENTNLTKQNQIKSGLMQDLLTGKVEVKVEQEETA